MSHHQKIEFVLYTTAGGASIVSILEATTWAEVVSELHESGMVNAGKVKVVKRTYQWVSDEPQLIDTDY
jgi:hypothetical protein